MLERQEEHKRRGQQEGRKKVPRLAEAPKQERQEEGSSGHEKRPQKPKIRPYESLSQSEGEMYRRRENEAQTLKKSGLHYDSSLFFCFYLSL